MAKYSLQTDSTTGITHLQVVGDIVPAELLAFMQTEEYQNRSDLLLGDLRQATLTKIRTADLIQLVRDIKPLTRDGLRVAYIFSQAVDFGIANMFKVYADQLSYQVTLEAFTDLELAKQWLLQGN